MKRKPAARMGKGAKMIGSVYSGPDRYQWNDYVRRVERITAERAAKAARQKKEQS